MLVVCPACGTGYDLDAETLGRGRKVRCAACRHTWFAPSEPPRSETAAFDVAACEPATSEPAAPEPAISDSTASDEGPASAAAPADGAMPMLRPAPTEPPLDIDWADSEFGPVLDGAPAPVEPVVPTKRASSWRAVRPSKPRPARRRAAPRPVSGRTATAFLLAALAAVGLFGALGREAVVRVVPDLAGLYALIGLPVNIRGLEFRHVVGRSDIDDGMPVLAVEGEIANVAPRRVEVPALRLALRGAGRDELYAWIVAPPKRAASPGESMRFRARLPAPAADAKEVTVRFARDTELKLGMRR